MWLFELIVLQGASLHFIRFAVCLFFLSKWQLKALGIPKAHIVGASMGGMIAQLMALRHADQVLSLTSIMSTTYSLAGPGPTDEANRGACLYLSRS